MAAHSAARGGALRRLAVQQAATRAMSDGGSLPEALRHMLESVCLALDWQLGETWTVDTEQGVLRVAAQWRSAERQTSELERSVRSLTLARGEGLAGEVWQTGAPVFVPDIAASPHPRCRRAAEAGLRSALGVPLRVDDEVAGVMVFLTDREAMVDDALMATLTHVGQLVGNAVRRRQAEAAVRISEARKRAVLDAALDCIVTVDQEGRIVEMNRAAERTFGYSREEGVGKPMAEFILPPHLRDRHVDLFRRHATNGDEPVLGRRMELEAMRRDGSVFPVEIAVTEARIDDVVAYTAYIRDIGDRRQTEERLREEIRINETLQRLALSFATERDQTKLLQLITDTATVLIDAQHGAFFFNEAGERGTDYALVSVSGGRKEEFEEFPLPRKTPLFAPTYEGRRVVRVDDVRTHPDYGALGPQPPGHPPVASYLAVPVKAPSGEVLGGLFFGHEERGRFTEQHEKIVVGIASHAAVALDNLRLYDRIKRSEETAHSAYRMAAEAARRKDEFIAMLSHELRNPLAPIMTAIELMKMDSDRATLESSRVVIERQPQHLLRLVDDLLDISRITRGKISIDRRPVPVREVIESAVEMASPLYEKKEHRLHVEVEDGLWVAGDRSRLAQVVTNLLTNAARYTEPGGNVWLTAARDDAFVEIRVRDDGIGIDPGLLDRMFEPFSQGEQDIDRSQGGLGLGLALVKSLTEMHGGTGRGRSDGDGAGSEFVVRLPAVEVGTGPRPSVTPPLGMRIRKAEASCVLVVDDNPDAAEIMARGLRRLGHEAHVAHDGPSALATAPVVRPDVAILDIGLPVMDGYALAKRLRRLPELRRVRLVAVTGYGQISDRMRSRAAGFDVHLVKPVSIEELADALE